MFTICPLKAAARIMSPALLGVSDEKAQEYTKCDESACGFWSETETDDGVREGCAVGLLPTLLTEVGDSIVDTAEATEGVQGTLMTTLALADEKFGIAGGELANQMKAAKAKVAAEGGAA